MLHFHRFQNQQRRAPTCPAAPAARRLCPGIGRSDRRPGAPPAATRCSGSSRKVRRPGCSVEKTTLLFVFSVTGDDAGDQAAVIEFDGQRSPANWPLSVAAGQHGFRPARKLPVIAAIGDLYFDQRFSHRGSRQRFAWRLRRQPSRACQVTRDRRSLRLLAGLMRFVEQCHRGQPATKYLSAAAAAGKGNWWLRSISRCRGRHR